MDERVVDSSGGIVQTGAAEGLSEYYIEAQTSLVERPLRTLKGGDGFVVLDAYGDLGIVPGSPEGLFFHDTRHLSRFELRFEGRRPLLLSSVIQDDNAALNVDLTNPDVRLDQDSGTPRDIIAIDRTKFLRQGVAYERIGLRNYDSRPRRFRLDLRFDADFRDLFEVRGIKRVRRGERTVDVPAADRVSYRYQGLDGFLRRTELCFTPAPTCLEGYRATFEVTLGPEESSSILVTIACREGEEEAAAPPFLAAYRDTRRALRASTAGIATVESSNAAFNDVACRATSDLYMLVSETGHGPYPYAGIPWYSTVFGRDGIITAMLLLWLDPALARGVLRHLAATQATAFDPASDAQPGKILHERRFGEMANLGEVPFRRYYGTVDATPLFVMLAGQYFERTGDRATIEALWPQIEAALAWCDTHGDRDGDGFVEYYRETENGLANQGWKDSHDSIFHADGSSAEGPIALCEVQAYLFAAKRAGATLARALGAPPRAERLDAGAERLRLAFEDAFWCEEIGTYALALDGAKRPCRVRTSNAGHALFAGIASPDRARRVAETLMHQESYTGWGIRTLARGEPRYNPMSYHNGSVWPHDNALVALGFARYGLKREAAAVFEGLFDAAAYQELRRLPELFCGFLRRRRRGPTAYPVACSPQAWAAAAPFGLLAACLGLDLRVEADEVRFTDPVLPDFLDEVVLRRVRLGRSRLDIRFHRHGAGDVTLNVLAREGSARVVLMK
jgi:glycogen debranching enzyme